MEPTPNAKIPAPVKKKEQEKERESKEPVQETKKLGQEIEEIFRANRKNRKESSSIREDRSTKAELRGEEKGKKKKNTAKVEIEKKNKERYIMHENSESRAKRRRTADGLPIYSAEELGIGKSDAGETPLCPFDCSCCF
ncbi:hypothetical protein KSP40_PGU021451 [Platanthera guangdongensis]|uniref:DUF1764 domain-containing protein n=1 Tax=Platanthera guangdongensis TaxID=2320717 RepID=A0ABR2N4E9_9ASPA